MRFKNQLPKDSILLRFRNYFRILCNSSDEYFFATDIKNNIIMVSPNMVQDFALPGKFFHDMDKYWLPLIHPDDKNIFLSAMVNMNSLKDSTHNCEYRILNRYAEYIWVRCRGEMSFDKNTKEPVLFAGIISNMGKKASADDLTNLLNKYQFEIAIRDALKKKEEENSKGLIMLFGIDNFKIINESQSRHIGDQLLKIAAAIISAALPKGMLLYKLDGDQFAIVAKDRDEEFATTLFNDVQKSFCIPHNIENKMIFCTISAGTVLYPTGGKDYQILYKHLEATLAFAKKSGKNKLSHFSKETYNRWLRSISLRENLYDSIQNNFTGFSLFYQPQIESKGLRLLGAEALLRWRGPNGKMVSPMEFIRILEETKMIIPVGMWIFETAVSQCKKWQKYFPGIRISINLSYEQVKVNSFRSFVEKCLRKYDLSPESIILELTETAIVSDWVNINKQFDAFRAMGIKIAMDDFGTGYSSLAYFKKLSCDIVKIDRAFVKGIIQEKSDFDIRLVKSTIELCHSVGICCCIEGVETEEEFKLLRDICNIDILQGYFFGRPVGAEDFYNNYLKECELNE